MGRANRQGLQGGSEGLRTDKAAGVDTPLSGVPGSMPPQPSLLPPPPQLLLLLLLP